jgi:type IV pilus assembly protein PilY1
MLDDSEGPGNTCRHNNQTYAVGGPAGVLKYPGNYPGEGSGSGNFNWVLNSTGCPTTPTTVAIPRHYYSVDSVEFCDNTIGTANDQWKGFGSGAVSHCQKKNDLTAFVNVHYGQFHRTDLINDGRTFSFTDIITKTPGTRTYAEEMTNYANWFSFYSTRILAAKTLSATAFAYLDKGYRVGFHTLNTPDTAWLDVNDFDATQRSNWNAKLFAINVTNGNTPTLDALLRIGNLFKTGGSGGLPALESGTLPASAADPISPGLSCQSNFHILFTDGATQQVNVPTVAGNADGVEPASFPAGATTDQVLPQINTRLGAAWYPPFKESTAVSDSLADIATYYWATDLRPGLKNDVPAWPGTTTPPLVYPKKEGDGDWETDVAW